MNTRIIITKNKLARSKFKFSRGVALHHIKGIGGYYKINCWVYAFDEDDNSQAKSLLSLILQNSVLVDSKSTDIKNLDKIFKIIDEYENIAEAKRSIDLEIAKAKTIYHYHKLVLNETDKNKLNELKAVYKQLEANKREKLNYTFTYQFRRKVQDQLNQIRDKIRLELRTL